MKISKKKTLVLSFLGLAAAAVCAVGAGNTNRLFSSRADLSHNLDCQWNHYSEVAASVTTPGCKEFWACCSHPGEHVLRSEDVTGTNITDKGALASDLIAGLSESDDRYISPLLPGYEVVYDTTVADWVALCSGDAGTPSHGFTDEVYGPYAKNEHLTRNGDQIAISPDLGNHPEFNGDIRIYETLTFWVMADQDINSIGVKKNRYDTVKHYNLVANTWTKIEFNADDIGRGILYQGNETAMGFGTWGSVNDISFKFTSIYGKLKESTVLLDASTKGFVDGPYPCNGTFSVNNIDATTGRVYSEVANMHHNEWMWLVPDSTELLVDYDFVYFYVRSSADLSGRGITNNYDSTKQAINIVANVWTRVFVEPSTLSLDTLDDMGFGGYGGFDTLTLQFSSIYAIAKPNHCVDMKIHTCHETVTVASKSSYAGLTSVKFDAKLSGTASSWCGLGITTGTPDFYAVSSPAVINPTINVWQTWEYILVNDGSGYYQITINGVKVTEGECAAFEGGFAGKIFFVCAADGCISSFSIDNVSVTYNGGSSQTNEDFEGSLDNNIFSIGEGASIISKN